MYLALMWPGHITRLSYRDTIGYVCLNLVRRQKRYYLPHVSEVNKTVPLTSAVDTDMRRRGLPGVERGRTS